MQRPRFIFLALISLGLIACNTLKKARDAVHGNSQADTAGAVGESEDPPDATTGIPTGKAGLEVEVDPPVGISILFDGVKVATQSPYVTLEALPGNHTVLVRGMGYLPVILPLVLKVNEVTKLPVSLRARPQSREPEPDVATTPAPPADKPSPVPVAPTPQAAELPSALWVNLNVLPQPAGPILLDGTRLEGKALRLHRSSGSLQVGKMSLSYNVLDAGILEFEIPSDQASWTKDGVGLKMGSRIRLSHGFSRVRRQGTDGSDQSLVIRRWD